MGLHFNIHIAFAGNRRTGQSLAVLQKCLIDCGFKDHSKGAEPQTFKCIVFMKNGSTLDLRTIDEVDVSNQVDFVSVTMSHEQALDMTPSYGFELIICFSDSLSIESIDIRTKLLPCSVSEAYEQKILLSLQELAVSIYKSLGASSVYAKLDDEWVNPDPYFYIDGENSCLLTKHDLPLKN
ncbi:hypothetical protein QEH52_19075 [Coraliomargarita sp. SDUM461003]|uniref:Phosphotyrosine protein phosphatase I domain-containing protein n=1 Tax=Thalassobacterium maritimum TaxID=3041265 RepID=A0ABU1B223_9BACT|nr:hypothetical protein [Coraliomargarita sp. SDUM461003]MDQ8209630.1 hypothetical protein [Coraliomargarita sp. SDUM461003]